MKKMIPHVYIDGVDVYQQEPVSFKEKIIGSIIILLIVGLLGFFLYWLAASGVLAFIFMFAVGFVITSLVLR